MHKFWMVIKATGCGSEQTRHRHSSYESAINEAERLCRSSGGDAFIVLEAKDYLELQPIKCEPLTDPSVESLEDLIF